MWDRWLPLPLRRASMSAPLRPPYGPRRVSALQAPEVYRQEAYNEKADVYSYSIIAYELLHRYMMISATDGSVEECQVGGGAGRGHGGSCVARHGDGTGRIPCGHVRAQVPGV